MYNFKELDDYFNDFFPEYNLGCFSVAVANGGKIVYDIYKADSSKQEYKNFNDCTRLNLGSVTKIYIGILIIKLIEEGKITADDYIQKYIPEFKYDDVKIIHLLTHTSGIKESENIDLTKTTKQKEVFDAIYSAPKQSIVPGNECIYYTYGYSVLTDLIQRVTQTDIESYASEIIFKPLNLRRTSFNKDIKNNVIMPFDKESNTFLDFSKAPATGNTGIYSVASELLKVGNIFLDFFSGRRNRILSEAGFKFALTPGYFDLKRQYLKTPIFFNRGIIDKYSCFGDLSSPNTFGHAGFSGCMLSIDLDNDIAVAIMSNSIQLNADPTNYKKIINRIMACF